MGRFSTNLVCEGSPARPQDPQHSGLGHLQSQHHFSFPNGQRVASQADVRRPWGPILGAAGSMTRLSSSQDPAGMRRYPGGARTGPKPRVAGKPSPRLPPGCATRSAAAAHLAISSRLPGKSSGTTALLSRDLQEPGSRLSRDSPGASVRGRGASSHPSWRRGWRFLPGCPDPPAPPLPGPPLSPLAGARPPPAPASGARGRDVRRGAGGSAGPRRRVRSVGRPVPPMDPGAVEPLAGAAGKGTRPEPASRRASLWA